MKLLLRQRIFAFTDSYDIYDEIGNPRYQVRTEFLTLGHQIHIYDLAGNEVAAVHQEILHLLPTFVIEIHGREMGYIKREFSLFHPQYSVEYMGWDVQGDFFSLSYEVFDHGRPVMNIEKELFRLSDTYTLNIQDPANELHALALAIAIDAANCND